jgi:hypothetical protein
MDMKRFFSYILLVVFQYSYFTSASFSLPSSAPPPSSAFLIIFILIHYHLYFLPKSSFPLPSAYLVPSLTSLSRTLSSPFLSFSSSVLHTLSHASSYAPVVSLHCLDTHSGARKAWKVKTAQEPDRYLDQIDTSIRSIWICHSSNKRLPTVPMQFAPFPFHLCSE